MKKQGSQITKTVETVEGVVAELQDSVDRELQPIRKSILKRFPTLFLLAVTFGVALVFYSIEVIFSQSEFISTHPWLSLGIGLAILIATGTLYRKLD